MVFIPTKERIGIRTLGIPHRGHYITTTHHVEPKCQKLPRPQQLPSGLQSTSSHGKVAWEAIADTPNYNLIAYHASLAHSSKGYRAITCRYIQMTEQLRLLYQLQGNCSHSAETGTLKSSIIATERGLKMLPASFFCQCPLALGQNHKTAT